MSTPKAHEETNASTFDVFGENGRKRGTKRSATLFEKKIPIFLKSFGLSLCSYKTKNIYSLFEKENG